MSGIRVLKLYRDMLKEARKFSDYNFKNFAIDRIRYGFKENLNEADPQRINRLIKRAEEDFELIKRQVSIGQMYKAEKHLLDK